MKVFFCAVGLLFLSASCFEVGAKEAASDVVVTYKDAAMILGGRSGFFKDELPAGASLEECVAALNRVGVYVGLLEVVNEQEFSLSDCARAMGQLDLVFSGEAEYEFGKVKLPKNIASWEEFCMINDVNYRNVYWGMCAYIRLLQESEK